MSRGQTDADAATLAAKVAQYQWHHSLDLGDGVVTPGSKSLQEIDLEKAAFFDRVDFRGRSVVDIGAWHGTFSFEAKRHGETTIDLSNLTDPALRRCPGAQWSPNVACMMRLLQAAGFADIEAFWHPHAHNRGIFFAWRTPAARKATPNAIDMIDPAPNVLSRAASKLPGGRIGYYWRKLRKAMNASAQPGGAS